MKVCDDCKEDLVVYYSKDIMRCELLVRTLCPICKKIYDEKKVYDTYSSEEEIRVALKYIN